MSDVIPWHLEEKEDDGGTIRMRNPRAEANIINAPFYDLSTTPLNKNSCEKCSAKLRIGNDGKLCSTCAESERLAEARAEASVDVASFDAADLSGVTEMQKTNATLAHENALLAQELAEARKTNAILAKQAQRDLQEIREVRKVNQRYSQRTKQLERDVKKLDKEKPLAEFLVAKIAARDKQIAAKDRLIKTLQQVASLRDCGPDLLREIESLQQEIVKKDRLIKTLEGRIHEWRTVRVGPPMRFDVDRPTPGADAGSVERIQLMNQLKSS
jgi:hypothetical protein